VERGRSEINASIKDNIKLNLCELDCDVNSIVIAQDVQRRDFVQTATNVLVLSRQEASRLLSSGILRHVG
jgi:hypothetical protein